MNRDLRDTCLFQESEAFYRNFLRPGSGLICDATDVSSNGKIAAFTGILMQSFNEQPLTRICITDLGSGDTRVVTFGPNTDRLPKISPDGQSVAFVSDRGCAGDFQLYILDLRNGAARPTARVEGWVEYLHWSGDGKQILLGVAGCGADVAGAQGAKTTRQVPESVPAWLPRIETGNDEYRWRSVWVYRLRDDSVELISGAEINVWEAVWCGDRAIAAITSPGPGEGLWYSAKLFVIDVETGCARELYEPDAQLGCPSASPSGERLAVIEGLCSDRGVVSGELRVIDTSSGAMWEMDTDSMDVTCIQWISEQNLLMAGHSDFDTVITVQDMIAGKGRQIWRSGEITTGGVFASICGFGDRGDCVFIGEGFRRAPEVGVLEAGRYRTVKSFGPDAQEEWDVIGWVHTSRWAAPDGLDVHGWLICPRSERPYPVIMMVHGGPVWHYRPFWLGRRGAVAMMLLKRGYALFLPNPRGSTGRGQQFVRCVMGDLGGADTRDCLSGLDHLVAQGIAHPHRIGVTGVSYGGYMTCWLITQDSRFGAAVAVSPFTNPVTEHLISNIPHCVSLFMGDSYGNVTGNYFKRSPIMHAHHATTPTLSICGALDRCTPPEEAIQFHSALLESCTKSVLVTYPTEGHGVRQWPAIIDYAARVVGWFEEHISAAAGNVSNDAY